MTIQFPRSHLPACLRYFLRSRRRLETREHPLLRLVQGPACTKRVSTERERRHGVVPAPALVFAVHDLRLVRVQGQADVSEPTADRAPNLQGLSLGHTVDHRIVGEPLKLASRILPGQPEIEPVMKEQ